MKDSMITQSIILTIYTPTYNRAKLLPRVFESLLAQTCKDFIWMVVDDGSTDNTFQLVDEWRKTAPFEIRYYYKKNEGVHTARDLAYRKVTTELISNVDSDDFLLDNYVETVIGLWKEKGNKETAGIVMPMRFPNGERIGNDFPNLDRVLHSDLLYKYKIHGDFSEVFRSDLMKEIPKAPIFQNEKLVGESWKIVQLPQLYFLLIDEPLVCVDYRDDGYSKNIREIWFKNVNGFREEYRQNIESLREEYLIPRLKYNIKYIISSIYAKKPILCDSPRPIETALMVIPGLVGYLYTLLCWRQYKTV